MSQRKKQKVENFSSLQLLLWNENILYEIIKFIKNVKDFIHLAETCKNFYHWILENEITINLIFKNYNFTKLPNIIPNYLLNLKYLNIFDTNFTIEQLQLFTKVQYLTLPEYFKFKSLQNLQNLLKNLKKLFIYRAVGAEDFNFKILKENLTELNVSYTNVTDEQINCLQNLTNLDISGCESITGDCLQNFTKLKTLQVEGLYLEEEDLEKYLNNLKNNLTNLNLSLCSYINGKCLQNLQNLTILKMKFIENINAFYLSKLNLLKYLNLKQSNIYNVNDLNNLSKNLEYLQIEYCISDKHLQNLNNLKILKLSNCNEFTGEYLKNMKNLIKLKANNTNLKDKNLMYCKQLKYLNCLQCYEINGNGLLNLENLQHLEIGCYENCNIKDEHFKNLQNLKFLKIEFCNNITDNLFLNLNNLKTLFLENCNEINGCNFTKNLTSLTINGCVNIKEENLIKLTNLKRLIIQELDFSGKCLQNFTKLNYFVFYLTLAEFKLFENQDLKDLKEKLKNENSMKNYFTNIDCNYKEENDEEEEDN